MRDLLFLVPLVAGFGIMALGFQIQIPKGPAMNRPAFGTTLVVGSLFLWLSSAILLAHQGQYYFLLDVLTVLVFFVGLAFFFPQPSPAASPNQHGLAGTILIWIGLILGFAHSLALIFTVGWPAQLLQAYESIGLHAPSVVP